MKIDILTIFPQMFEGIFSQSLFKKAMDKQLCIINIHNLRDYCSDKHKQTDDIPYGGGPGMVFKPQPLAKALDNLKHEDTLIIHMCPKGHQLNHKLAQRLSELTHLIIIASHYEGIDQRIIDKYVNLSISIGDYILFGGEIPAMIICDSIIRLIPSVVGNEESIIQDSFQNNLLDHPHYTRPANFDGQNVPSVLTSGNHSDIDHWRSEQRVISTFNQRSDIFACSDLSELQKKQLENYLKGVKKNE